MNEKELRVPYNAPLNEIDSETQTFGCRANNPDICGYNQMSGVCAFSSTDHICKKPSRAWKKKYNELKKQMG